MKIDLDKIAAIMERLRRLFPESEVDIQTKMDISDLLSALEPLLNPRAVIVNGKKVAEIPDPDAKGYCNNKCKFIVPFNLDYSGDPEGKIVRCLLSLDAEGKPGPNCPAYKGEGK